ncbi:MAG: family N-acetyltransferase [Sediminibacterium sp.]|nr:family N-acetyltransferase [Sediminibacterium sp.]
MEDNIIVRVANGGDTHYAQTITDEMESSAKARGTGIAKRSPEYVAKKMEEGKAVIAVLPDGTWIGFCYIEVWGHEQFVANSGLIVSPEFRKSGTAKRIKQTIFNLSRQKYPGAKIFGLTTGLAVMKINSDLGYEPVTYSELTDDEEFWAGCKSCVNYDILMSKDRKNCMCTAMLYDPVDHYEPQETSQEFQQHSKLYERFMKIKHSKLLQLFRKSENGGGTGSGSKSRSLLHFFLNL